MYRPSKKKNQNTDTPGNNTADDRHLIDTEESAELSIEDKISLYWMENKTFIAGCVAVLVLVLVGINGMRMYASGIQSKQQAAYAEAAAEGSLDAFARDNSGDALGGLAALTLADEAYSQDNHAEADEFYTLALEGLSDNILAGRARLGQAFARYRGGDPEAGIALLNAIYADTALPSAILAEAAYHLAVHAYAAGDLTSFRSFAERIATLDQSGQWQRRIDTYRQIAPADDSGR